MSDDLMERFDEVESEDGGLDADSDQTRDQERNSEPKTARNESPSSVEATRSRSQYPMYLSEELQEELNDRFNKFNARRELNDQEQVEKHKHFLEGLIRSALDADNFEEYVEEELSR